MHELTAADLRASRLHLFWLQLLFTAVVGLMVIAEWELSPAVGAAEAVRPPLGSLPYLAVGLQTTAIALAVAVWFVPVWTFLWMVPVAWLLPYGNNVMPTQWRALAVASVAVFLWCAVRSRRAVPSGPRRRVSFRGAFRTSWAFQQARLGWLGLAGAVVLAAALLVAHQVMSAEVRNFEERAENAVVEVVGFDDEYYEVMVLLDGREITLEEPEAWEQPAVGDMVPVLVDPADPEHVVFLGSLEDPSWLVGLAVAAPLAGLWFGLPIILRSRRRRDLVERGAPATMVKLACSDEGDFRLVPTDADVPILEVVHFAGLVPRKEVVAFINDWDSRFDPDDEDPDGSGDESESLPESDEVLAGWADDVKDLWRTFDDDSESACFSADMPEDEKLMAEADFGPDVRGGEPFVMLGSWSHGSTVALLRSTGAAWLAEIREPRFTTGAQPVLPWESSTTSRRRSSARRELPSSPGFFDKLKSVFFAWTNSNSRWLRWVVALVVAVAAAQFMGLLVWGAVDEGGGFFAWIPPVLFGVPAMAAPFAATAWMVSATTSRSALGLESYGLLVDEIVARDRLVAVVAGESAIAIRMKDPEDALAVFPEDVGQDLTPEQAAEQIRLWFASAPADGRSGRRPSPFLVAGILQIVLAVVSAFWLLA